MASNVRVPTSGQPHVDYQTPSISNDIQICNFKSPGSKLTSEERFAMPFNVHSASNTCTTAELSALMPPPTEIPQRGLSSLDLALAKRDVSAPHPPALLTARVIENLSKVAYPEGIKSPRAELNVNVKDGRFRYDRDFLMQFMHICKEKPPTLPALDVLGIEPIDRSSFPMALGGSGRHRNASSAIPVPADCQASMGNFQSPGSKLTSAERFAMSNTRSASTSNAPSQFRSTVACTPSTGGPPMHGAKRVRRRTWFGFGAAPILGAGFESVIPLELSANRWVPMSMTRKAQLDVDSPALVDRKVKALLNKLTMVKFETISDQIIYWANKSVNEKDGRTLIQVIRLVFENSKATDEAWSGMCHALLCRKMMEQISPEVQDEGIKNMKGKPIAGGQLFRKHLLNHCQEDFERGWFAKGATPAVAGAKASDGHATKTSTHKKISAKEVEFCFDESYAAEKARRQGLGLVKFIGELFKLQILTERIMHKYVKKLLGNVENPEEEEIESLCQLLKTVGQLLDTPKARAHMDVYFTRMKELGKSDNDVIELRDHAWMSRDAAHIKTAADNVLAAKKKAAAEKEFFNQNHEHGPDGWTVANDSSIPRAPPKAGNLLRFGNINNWDNPGPAIAMAMRPSGVFAAGKKDRKRDTLSQTNSSSNMFHMLSQNPKPPLRRPRNPVARRVGNRALIRSYWCC
ncbi:ARM repeat-containing protein [Suillus cothurnatus]|nr:ARM repeat-containing protein [Suillus cothurnatus]